MICEFKLLVPVKAQQRHIKGHNGAPRETTLETMTRIFDNIDQDLLTTLRGTMQISKRADFCVGYLNLRGWQAVDDLVQPWNPEEDQVCRVLVGMQRPPYEEIRELYRQTAEGGLIDNATASRLKMQFAAHLREQITLGTLALNTSLFYWFWRVLFDGYHCGKENISEFESFSELKDLNAGAVGSLLEQLMNSFQSNAVRKSTVYKGSGAVEYDEFKISKSKDVLDVVDSYFLSKLGLSPLEMDFVSNYDIKYRIGQSMEGEDD